MRLPDIQPGTSAASNQRAAFLKPPHVAVGCSHSADVNLPAAKVSLIRVPRNVIQSPPPPTTAWGIEDQKAWVRCQRVLS